MKMKDADEVIKNCIADFCCGKDEEIVGFLKNSSILYEYIGKSRTYFLIDEEVLPKVSVLGFFTISLHSVSIPINLTNRQIQRLDGLYSKNKQGRLVSVPAYLIGQLAKNDKYANNITGRELLEYAFAKIKQTYEEVGGRIVAIDCRPIEKIRTFYKENGFIQIAHNKETNLDQFVFMLNNAYIAGDKNHKNIKYFNNV